MMTYARYIAVSLSGDDSVTLTPACNAALVEVKIQLGKNVQQVTAVNDRTRLRDGYCSGKRNYWTFTA